MAKKTAKKREQTRKSSFEELRKDLEKMIDRINQTSSFEDFKARLMPFLGGLTEGIAGYIDWVIERQTEFEKHLLDVVADRLNKQKDWVTEELNSESARLAEYLNNFQEEISKLQMAGYVNCILGMGSWGRMPISEETRRRIAKLYSLDYDKMLDELGQTEDELAQLENVIDATARFPGARTSKTT